MLKPLKTKSENSTTKEFGLYLNKLGENMDKWMSLNSKNMEFDRNNLLFSLQNIEQTEYYKFKNIKKFLFDRARLSFNITEVKVNKKKLIPINFLCFLV